MGGLRKCERCGAALPDEGWEGLCPKCLVRVSLETPALAADASGGPPGGSGKSEIENPKSPLGKVRYFGDYELLEEIAHAGMGVVFKARQVSLNRIVALKMILAGPYASKDFVQRFRTEAEAAAKLQHPNIVAIHEVGEHEGHHYFSMDYVEGQNLAQLVRDKPLPAQRAAAYVKTIAEAIHYAHQQGILHRDLKPSNVLIDQFDQPRVTDFGLAKRLAPDSQPSTQDSHLTQTGQVLGTPNYMPPEQASGKRGEIGPRTDVYSLGAILYFLLTARPPFFAETFEETLSQVLNADVPSLRLLNASIPRDLETICLKCLEKDPMRRYDSAQVLAEDLNRWMRGEPILARPSNAWEQTVKWAKRQPALATLGAVICAAALICGLLAGYAVKEANQTKATLEQLEIQRAEDLFTADDSRTALAHLASVLRQNPNNRVAAERLISALTYRP